MADFFTRKSIANVPLRSHPEPQPTVGLGVQQLIHSFPFATLLLAGQDYENIFRN